MNGHPLSRLALTAFAAVAFATSVVAQTPTQQDDTAPKAASSPHQRSATSTDAKEAPAATQTSPAAASTPHQQQITEGKMAKSSAERDRMMNDCMKKEGERNSALSADQVKKACTDKMSKAATETKHE